MKEQYISGFSDEIADDFDTQIKVLNTLGIDYMSIRGVDGKNISDYTLEEIETLIVPRLRAANINVSSIGSPIGKINIEDEDRFEEQKKCLKVFCQACQSLKCKYIRIFSFYMPEGKVVENYTEEVIRKLQVFVDIAQEYGVILLHENEKDIFGDTGQRCKMLFERIKSPYFKGIFDFANFVQCQEDPQKCYELLKEHVAYIHIKDAVYSTGDNVLCGTGDGKIEMLLKAFIQEGYRGFLTLEPHLVIFNALQDLENKEAEEVIKENQASTGEEGFTMQYKALLKILERIKGV